MIGKFYKSAWLFCLTFITSYSLLAQSRYVEQFRESYEVSKDRVLYVSIDIDAAEVKLYKSPRNYEARVTLYYDEDEFEVYSDYNKKRSRLNIEFDKKGWVDSHDDDLKAEAVIELPPDVEIDLDAIIKAGQIDIDFGGLSLVALDLTTWAGEVLVEFSEPNKTEMDFLKVNTKIGETEIVKLGNARFKEAEINGGIGEMDIDFRGAFLSEAEADVDLDIGETNLHLPEDIGIKLAVSKFLFLSEINIPHRFKKAGRYYYSKNYDKANHVLVLHVSPGLGELRIGY